MDLVSSLLSHMRIAFHVCADYLRETVTSPPQLPTTRTDRQKPPLLPPASHHHADLARAIPQSESMLAGDLLNAQWRRLGGLGVCGMRFRVKTFSIR